MQIKEEKSPESLLLLTHFVRRILNHFKGVKAISPWLTA
jgi:hypothetical protein